MNPPLPDESVTPGPPADEPGIGRRLDKREGEASPTDESEAQGNLSPKPPPSGRGRLNEASDASAFTYFVVDGHVATELTEGTIDVPAAVAPARADPWAHRRGEPRLFAFFWTFYVMLAVGGSITWLARTSVVSVGSYGPAARIMLVVIGVGMVVLWPMTRLSQASPERNSVSSTLTDLLVVLLPVQIVVWPLRVLANWPLDIVAAVAGLMAAWGVLAGGVLALALGGRPLRGFRDSRLAGRGWWMGLVMGLVLAAPVAQGVVYARGSLPPKWLVMGSPITAIPALTGYGLIGPSAPVSRVQWDSIVGTLSLGVLAWAAAVGRNGLARGGRID